jgi:hypothetical protein
MDLMTMQTTRSVFKLTFLARTAATAITNTRLF